MREALALAKEMAAETGEIPDWGRARVQVRVQQVLGQKSSNPPKFWVRTVFWATCTASVAVVLIAFNFLPSVGRTSVILASPETSHLRSGMSHSGGSFYTYSSDFSKGFVTPDFEVAWFDVSWFIRPSKTQMDSEARVLHDVFPSFEIQSLYSHWSLHKWLNKRPDEGVRIVCGHPHWIGTAADKITVRGRWRGNAFEKEFAVSNSDLRAALVAARDYIDDQTK